MRLSHNIHHQNVAIVVLMIVRVFYKNLRNIKSLSKCVTNHLILQKCTKLLIQSQNISLYKLRLDKIQFLKNT